MRVARRTGWETGKKRDGVTDGTKSYSAGATVVQNMCTSVYHGRSEELRVCGEERASVSAAVAACAVVCRETQWRRQRDVNGREKEILLYAFAGARIYRGTRPFFFFFYDRSIKNVTVVLLSNSSNLTPVQYTVHTRFSHSIYRRRCCRRRRRRQPSFYCPTVLRVSRARILGIIFTVSI